MTQRLSDDCQFQCTDPILRCHICATDMHEKHLTEQLHYVTPQQRWDHSHISLFGHSWRHWLAIFLLQRKNANEEPARATCTHLAVVENILPQCFWLLERFHA